MLLATGASFYRLYFSRAKVIVLNEKLIKALLLTFLLTFILTWSPVDFWKFVPRILVISQFSYRFLAQVVWVGALLVAVAIKLFFNDHDSSAVFFIGFTLIVLSSSSWLMANYNYHPITTDEIALNPNFSYGSDAYLVRPSLGIAEYKNLNLFLDSGDGWLNIDKETSLPRKIIEQNKFLKFEGKVPTEYFRHPVNLQILINGKKMLAKKIKPGVFSWNVPLSELKVPNTSTFTIAFNVDNFFIPKKVISSSTDSRKLAIQVKEIRAVNSLDDFKVHTYRDVRRYCDKSADVLNCRLRVDRAGVYELPMLYYPDLIRISLDGEPMKYKPAWSQRYWVVSLDLKPGDHSIVAKFVGLMWANWVSGLAWLVLILLLTVGLLMRSKNQVMALMHHSYSKLRIF